MKQNEKMWAVLLYLSSNMWVKKAPVLDFDDEAWEQSLQSAAENGLNTILLDVGDGICFGSHPELAIEGSWSRTRVRREVKKASELGLTIIPKLNFSATHDFWLGEYERMVSTKTYYRVCRDLIHEVYDLFDGPRYIHLGMDEENKDHFDIQTLVVCRTGDLLWHDVQFLLDCVRETGATPWIWSDFLFDNPEDFHKHIGTEDLVLSPWNYNALREEHYTPIASRQAYVDYYGAGQYKSMNITYVEEDPFLVRFREQAIPNAERGYVYIPCASTINHCPYNTPELVEYFRDKAPDDSVRGFITAPWKRTTMEYLSILLDSIQLLGEAKKTFYPG